MDDSVDIGKEPPEVPEELKELHEQIRKKIYENYKNGKYRVK